MTPAFIGVHATQLEPAEIDGARDGGRERRSLPALEPEARERRVPGRRAAACRRERRARHRRRREQQPARSLGGAADGGAARASTPRAMPTAVPAAAAIAMATINGARALNLADEIGSLVAGKAADVICVDLGGIAHQPVLDPAIAAGLLCVAPRRQRRLGRGRAPRREPRARAARRGVDRRRGRALGPAVARRRREPHARKA